MPSKKFTNITLQLCRTDWGPNALEELKEETKQFKEKLKEAKEKEKKSKGGE